jgi:hypothetical protein
MIFLVDEVGNFCFRKLSTLVLTWQLPKKSYSPLPLTHPLKDSKFRLCLQPKSKNKLGFLKRNLIVWNKKIEVL